MSEIKNLSDQDIQYLVKLISAPTYKYMMRRINRFILQDKRLADISVNSFINVLVVAVASMDANSLRWIEKFYKMKTGQDINFDTLKFALTKNLNAQLGIELH